MKGTCLEPQLIIKVILGIFLVALMVQGWMVMAAPAVYEIRIESRAPFFSPKSLTVRPGETIRWVNHSPEAHTIIADACRGTSSCLLNSGLIIPHGFYDFSQLSPGRYSYHCGVHPFMRGTINVLTPPRQSQSI